jgi:hypothetical protein
MRLETPPSECIGYFLMHFQYFVLTRDPEVTVAGPGGRPGEVVTQFPI